MVGCINWREKVSKKKKCVILVGTNYKEKRVILSGTEGVVYKSSVHVPVTFSITLIFTK